MHTSPPVCFCVVVPVPLCAHSQHKQCETSTAPGYIHVPSHQLRCFVFDSSSYVSIM